MYHTLGGLLVTIGLPVIGAHITGNLFVGVATFTIISTAVAAKRLLPTHVPHLHKNKMHNTAAA